MAILYPLGGSNIKSIQRGIYANVTANNVTISPVDLSKAIVIINERTDGNTYPSDIKVRGKLTTTTNLELSRVTTIGTAETAWQVIEFNNVKSLQRGDFTFTEQTERTVAITTVNAAKSVLVFSFSHISDNATQIGAVVCRGSIKDNSTLAFSSLTNLLTITIHWQLVEFN